MREYLKFYIGGDWVEPAQLKTLEVINPATEAVCGHISLGSAADIDRAVKAGLFSSLIFEGGLGIPAGGDV